MLRREVYFSMLFDTLKVSRSISYLLCCFMSQILGVGIRTVLCITIMFMFSKKKWWHKHLLRKSGLPAVVLGHTPFPLKISLPEWFYSHHSAGSWNSLLLLLTRDHTNDTILCYVFHVTGLKLCDNTWNLIAISRINIQCPIQEPRVFWVSSLCATQCTSGREFSWHSQGAPNPRALGTQTSAIRAFCYFLNFIKFIGLTLVSKLT